MFSKLKAKGPVVTTVGSSPDPAPGSQEVADGVVKGAMEVDWDLLVLWVQVDKETLDNMLLNRGFGVNLIIVKEQIRLEL